MGRAPRILLPPSRQSPWLLPCQEWVLRWQESFWLPTAEEGRELPVQAAQMRVDSLSCSVPKPEPRCQHHGCQRLMDHSHFLAVHQAG